MFQQIVVDPIRYRCTGFGLHDWLPQISQSEGFIVDFSVIRGEVNFHYLLLLYGLEFSTVVGRGGVICECRSMLVCNIFGVCDGSTILSIQILLGAQTFFPDIFLTLSLTCFIGVSVDSFETHSVHDWHFFWSKRRRAFACDLLKADRVSPLSSRLCRTLLSTTRLAFRASRHSSSNQGFHFLGIVVALGMLSFAALVMISTKQCKGSASSRMSSLMPSKHRSWNCSQLTLETPNVKDHSSVVSLLMMVGSKLVWDNDHCHGYRAAPPKHFSGQVLVWRWWGLSLMLVCSHAGLGVSDRCGFRHWEHTDCVCLWISQWLHPGCQHHDGPTNSYVHWSHPR